jgi:predicted Rossmann-fold nucleotide-binding protein
VRPLPILLFGRDFWSRMVNFEGLAEEGVIAPHDLELFHWCEEADEAWDFVQRFYEQHPAAARIHSAPPE